MAWRTPNLNARRDFAKALESGPVKPPIIISCRDCDEDIPSDMIWCCGSCGQENRRTSLYSFLNKCQRCDKVPTSVRCPHCGFTNFLDGNQDGTHPARKPQPPPPPKVDPGASAERDHNARKRALERELVEERLKAELADIKTKSTPKGADALQREIMAELDQFMQKWSGAEDAVDAWKAKVSVTFRDNPEKLRRRLDILDFWLEQKGMK